MPPETVVVRCETTPKESSLDEWKPDASGGKVAANQVEVRITQIDQFRKIGMADLPTPFHEVKSLRSTLGIRPRLFMKRDDCTGLAFGGNKVRKLELIMGEAQSVGADTVITTGGSQSNHCRLTAAFARSLGMDPILVFDSVDPGRRQGNLLLDTILGAKLVFAGPEADVPQIMQSMAAELRSQGRRPYIVPRGGSTPLGVIGCSSCMFEILAQASKMGVQVDHAFVAAGLGGTQSGLILGAKMSGSHVRVHGVKISHDTDDLSGLVLATVQEAARLVDAGISINPEEVIVHEEYLGPDYGVAGEECLQAIRVMARTEGILLDPVYTGKVLHCIIDMCEKELCSDDDTLVLCHTGGTPALFAHEQHFQRN